MCVKYDGIICLYGCFMIAKGFVGKEWPGKLFLGVVPHLSEIDSM